VVLTLALAHIKLCFGPSGWAFQCLSPLGEYNLRLGVMKEIQPDMVATYQEK